MFVLNLVTAGVLALAVFVSVLGLYIFWKHWKDNIYV